MRMDMSSSSKYKSQMDVDETPPNHCETMAVSQDQGQDCDTNVLECSGNEDNLPKLYYNSGNEDKLWKLQHLDRDSMIGEHSSAESKGLTIYTDIWKTKTKGNDVAYKRSDFELSCGMVDAMEVARQVAIEVENRRETSCSSSQKVPDAVTDNPDSPVTMHGNETDENPSKEGLPEEGELESESDNGIVDFDLNQEICSDDTDHPLDTISNTVSIVSASRANPCFLPSHLQFEVAHG